ncbi:hypothetical protein IQ285_18360 [Burkholderia sp. R-69608]|uniref:hypothetical protein n=1 Tax=Paraburkholderia nemoris TaxID=2793076 RepID=UPI001914D02A|nr:hypothetical protein [Paraburkholderia nemoris]MBK5149658.1 hypothetical protein [Burkholderia sp. R-69608]
MNNTFNKIAAAALIPAITACSFPGVAPSVQPANGDFTALRKAIEAQAQAYSTGAGHWVYSEFWSNMILIPLAMGSVAALAFSHGAATTNILAGIGIGVGATSLVTTNLNGANKQQAYSLASNQLLCLRQTSGLYFIRAQWDNNSPPNDITPPSYDAPHDADLLNAKLQTLDPDIEKVTIDLNAVNAQIGKGAVLTLEDTKTINLASLALQQASTASTNGKAEVSAANQAYYLISRTFSKIDQQAYVSSKGALLTWSQATNAFNVPISAGNATTRPFVAPAPGGKRKLAPSNLAEIVQLYTDTTAMQAISDAVLSDSIIIQKKYTTANMNIAACTSGTP